MWSVRLFISFTISFSDDPEGRKVRGTEIMNTSLDKNVNESNLYFTFWSSG